MKFTVQPTSRFQKDLQRAEKRGYHLALLAEVIKTIACGQELPAKHQDHHLSGKYAMCKECHITPDWLLIYELVEKDLILHLTRTGTHSDLF